MGAATASGDRTNLERAARRLRNSESSFEEFSETFLSAQLWCRRGEEPGFVATGHPGHGTIPVYSTEAAFIEGEGSCPAFTVSGRDLLLLSPPGYTFLLDQGRETELAIVPVERADR